MKQLTVLIVFLLLLSTQASAKPKYVLIRKSLFNTWKYIHLQKPPKKLHKWFYDEKTDTYYRVKTMLGVGIPMDRIYITGN